MSVRHDDSVPVRYIEVQIDVPGTPEQVWQAIATGPGLTAWFVPTVLEEREGGRVVFEMGPGMESAGVVTRWEPPHRFAAEEKEWMPGAPPSATEIFVEAKAGGLCRVRLVNSLFTSNADWDDQLESVEKGWPEFLRLLRLYLTHFPGQRCTPVRALGFSVAPEEQAWSQLVAELGLSGVEPGERRTTRGTGAPALGGIVEQKVEQAGDHEVVLRLDEPAPGYALVAGGTCAGQVMLSLGLYLFGEGAAAVKERDEPAWQAWMSERFPAPAEVAPST
jgi:uncharacterized protein YndB with AHSA1/START domain